MHGTIYIDNASGRALRKGVREVRAANILYSGGGFHAGDAIDIAFRSADGAQYVIARGIACCDESTLTQRIGPPEPWWHTPIAAEDDFVVVRAADLRLYWQAAGEP